MMKIKRILVSQPKPDSDKSPYFELAKKNNIQIDFKPFIHVEPICCKEFRNSKINILDHSAIIFTSKTAIDHFFRVAKELRISIPETMKYFCISESAAFYLQKYIVFRKRKIFYSDGKLDDLMEFITKHNEEFFLVPVSDVNNDELHEKLSGKNIRHTKAVFYKTVASDLSEIKEINYDIMVFFSPSGIESLKKNFPDFEQNEIRIASFGPYTAKAVLDAGLRLDIKAPMPEAPSMTMAIENYIRSLNKKS